MNLRGSSAVLVLFLLVAGCSRHDVGNSVTASAGAESEATSSTVPPLPLEAQAFHVSLDDGSFGVGVTIVSVSTRPQTIVSVRDDSDGLDNPGSCAAAELGVIQSGEAVNCQYEVPASPPPVMPVHL